MADLNVVGLVLGLGLGLIPLFEGLFKEPVDQITAVNIGLGFSTDVSNSLGGNTPGVAL
jgi:hypothetical protein